MQKNGTKRNDKEQIPSANMPDLLKTYGNWKKKTITESKMQNQENWCCFKLIWRMDKILCAPTSPWSPNREQNQSSKLLKIKQKWTSTYLILTYILLTSTIREVRRSVRRISLLILGLQRLRSLWLKHFYIRIHTVLCRHSLQM